MLFNSLEFVVFFPVVLMIYFLIHRKLRVFWLLIASYFFYMCWKPKYLLLLLFSTAVTWGAGLLLERWREDLHKKRATAAAAILLNFGILFLFKYLDFLWHNFSAILGRFHVTLPENTVSLLLPVGISFYIFQAVGYTVDVYRGTIAAERNFPRYALFVSFFPQLVAGPIERSGNLLPQVRNLENGGAVQGERREDGLVCGSLQRAEG